ncbi:hypothetical protein GO496_03810 [Acidovorax citrulli]|nr:hypothetical protein [Paracidovorax citrulli]
MDGREAQRRAAHSTVHAPRRQQKNQGGERQPVHVGGPCQRGRGKRQACKEHYARLEQASAWTPPILGCAARCPQPDGHEEDERGLAQQRATRLHQHVRKRIQPAGRHRGDTSADPVRGIEGQGQCRQGNGEVRGLDEHRVCTGQRHVHHGAGSDLVGVRGAENTGTFFQ